MMNCGTILCAVPAECWAQRASTHLPVEFLRRFFRNLETLERRLRKEVAFDDECTRYACLCGQIEQVALSNAVFAPSGWRFRRSLGQGAFPAIRIGNEYVDLVRLLQLRGPAPGPEHAQRLGASVFRPAQLPGHLQAFSAAAAAHDYIYHAAIKHRLWFLKKRVIRAGCGLVEVPDALSLLPDEGEPHPDAVDGRSLWERFLAWFQESPQPSASARELRDRLVGNVVPAVATTDWMQYGVEDRGNFMENRLRSQIEQAIAKGAPVNLMNQRQNMVTQVFQEFIHQRSGESAAKVAVTYADGATVRPFPLRCLPRMPEGWAPTKEFHVGLISMRHLPIDQYIDVNWYRNVEVPSSSGLAAADEVCFQFSRKQIAELLAAQPQHRLRLHVYHSGYMPAVVGFYRAFVTTMASRKFPPGCLQVLPKLQPDAKGGFVEGRPWPE